MQGGVLAEVEGDVEQLDSFHRTYERDGVQFTRSLQVSQRGYLKSGTPVFKGEAAMEVVDEKDTVKIDDDTGKISVTTSAERRGKYTAFIIISGKMMAVSSGDGTFAFDLLPEANSGVKTIRTRLDLNAFAEDYYTAPNVDPWQVGFYGNIGQAEKGVVYGEDVFGDNEIGEVLERSKLNQLGLEYEYDGDLLKMTSSRSGYVEVYQPSNLDFTEFAQYLNDEISDFLDYTIEP